MSVLYFVVLTAPTTAPLVANWLATVPDGLRVITVFPLVRTTLPRESIEMLLAPESAETVFFVVPSGFNSVRELFPALATQILSDGSTTTAEPLRVITWPLIAHGMETLVGVGNSSMPVSARKSTSDARNTLLAAGL